MPHMLLRWLISVFPREVRSGWHRLVTDAFVWCALAVGLTILAELELGVDFAAAPGKAGPVSFGARAIAIGVTVVRAVAPPLVFVIAAVRFDAQRSGPRSAWAAVGRAVLRRTFPALVAWLAASAVALAVSLVAQFAVIAAFDEIGTPTERLRAISGACRMFIYLGILARFAYVPFIVSLERRDRRRTDSRESRFAAVVYRVGWPLPESWTRTQNIGWRLFPYIFLVIYSPVLAGYVPAALRAPVSFLSHLAAFTALAVLFNHYSERGGEVDRASSESSRAPAS